MKIRMLLPEVWEILQTLSVIRVPRAAISSPNNLTLVGKYPRRMKERFRCIFKKLSSLWPYIARTCRTEDDLSSIYYSSWPFGYFSTYVTDDTMRMYTPWRRRSRTVRVRRASLVYHPNIGKIIICLPPTVRIRTRAIGSFLQFPQDGVHPNHRLLSGKAGIRVT
jgi:hypothetical protein